MTHDQRDEKGQDRLEAIKTLVGDAQRFYRDELWDRDPAALPRLKAFLFSACRVTVIVIRGFVHDKCALQSSALTCITLMSLVPVLALMFSVSKGLGAQAKLMESIGLEPVKEQVVENGETVTKTTFRVVPAPPPPPNGAEPVPQTRGVRDLPEQAQKVVIQIFNYVERTNLGKLGTVGFLLLFWAVIKTMSKVENTFNSLWGVKGGRPLFRKFTDYISVLVIVPVLLLAATSVNATLRSQQVISSLGALAGVYRHLLGLSVIGCIILAFTFLYLFIPNTRVRLFPALAGGAVGGLLWYAVQWIYIVAQIGVAKWNTIYGTFAAVPFFLAWLYANWSIVLFGGEVSFAVQNHRTYIMEGGADEASQAAREMLGILLVHDICRTFLERGPGWSAVTFGTSHAVPARLLATVLRVLTLNGIIAPVDGRQAQYLPARDIGDITLADVEDAFRGPGDTYAKQVLRMVPAEVGSDFLSRYETFRSDLSTVTFRDLATASDA